MITGGSRYPHWHDRAEQAILLSRRIADQYRIYFIARFLARCALTGARRCSSAKRRAAFTSLADSDPGHREARAGRARVRQHDSDKLLP